MFDAIPAAATRAGETSVAGSGHRLWPALFAAALSVAASFTVSAPAFAEYPEKNVTVIVGFPAGGTSDSIARAFSEDLSDKFGKRFVIENMPGGAQTIAASSLAKAAPDGYTLGLISLDVLVSNPITFKSIPYDAKKDFRVVAAVFDAPSALVAPKGSDIKSYQDLLKKLSEGTSLSIGHHGKMSMTGFISSDLKNELGASLLDVPYQGDAAIMTALLAGEIDVAFVGMGTAVGQKSELTILGVTGSETLATFPDVPTLVSQGVKSETVRDAPWFIVAAPAGTPDDVVDRLETAIHESARLKDMVAKFGVRARTENGAQFEPLIAEQRKTWEAVLTRLGLAGSQ